MYRNTFIFVQLFGSNSSKIHIEQSRLPVRGTTFCHRTNITYIMPALTSEINNDTTHEVNGKDHSILKKDIKSKLNGVANGEVNGEFNIPASLDLSPAPSIFTPICHPRLEEAVRDVDGYYLQHWGFSTEAARKKFVAAGFSRVTCLYFPKALDERIQYACSLLTIFFLIDGKLCKYTMEITLANVK